MSYLNFVLGAVFQSKLATGRSWPTGAPQLSGPICQLYLDVSQQTLNFSGLYYTQTSLRHDGFQLILQRRKAPAARASHQRSLAKEVRRSIRKFGNSLAVDPAAMDQSTCDESKERSNCIAWL